jgi:transaldolase
MATEKLADGIRRFAADQIELEHRVRQLAQAA